MPRRKEQRKVAPVSRELQIRSESANEETSTVDLVLSGGAAVRRYDWWNDRYYSEELVISEGAVDLARMNGHASFLDNHRSYGSVLETVLGVFERAWVEGGKLMGRVRVDRGDDKGKEVWRKIKQGFLRHISVGYRWLEVEKERGEGDEWIYRVTRWEPYEGSLVSIPADPDGAVRGSESGKRRSEGFERNTCTFITRSDMDPDETTTEDGEERSEGTQPEETGTPAEGEGRSADEASDDSEGTRNEGDSESDESHDDSSVQRSEANSGKSVPAAALERCERLGLDMKFARGLAGLTEEQANKRILEHLEGSENNRSIMPQARHTGAESERTAQRDAISNALLHRASPDRVKLTDHGRKFRGNSILELAREFVPHRGEGLSRQEVISRALNSTGDFPIIMSNVANKTLLDAYRETPQTFVPFCRKVSAPDFKTIHRIQAGGFPSLLEVNEHGEYEHGTTSEKEETYKLRKFGRIIGFSREAMINDDLDALTSVAAQYGAAVARLRSDVVYAVLTANPDMSDEVALFHGDHGNLGAGAGAGAPSEDTLNALCLAMESQVTLEGNHMSLFPEYIIIPPTHRIAARKQITQVTPDKTENVNPFAGDFKIIVEPRLGAGSSKKWYAACNPNACPTIEYATLEGEGDGPSTEMRVGFEVDGIEIKVRHDFAAKAIDHRGLYRNDGE